MPYPKANTVFSKIQFFKNHFAYIFYDFMIYAFEPYFSLLHTISDIVTFKKNDF